MPENDDDVKVTDKRRFKLDEEGGEKDTGENKEERHDGADEDTGGVIHEAKTAYPGRDAGFKINFIDLVNSLAGTTLIQLGAVADPQTNIVRKDLNAAKQTIEVLELLKEKTVGNLTNEEAMMLDNVLFDLRMRYVMVQEGKK